MKLPESRGETSTRHNNRVAELLSLFQKQDLLFGHRSFDTEEQLLVPLFKSEKYVWAKEVTRTMSSELQWRHDIFGGHSLHKHTKLSPWVAVEVIDSHFPSDTALDTWLEISSEFPYFVLFDFVQKRNYFLKVDEDKNQVRVIYFIFDGAVWRSGKRWEGCTAAIFREELSVRIGRG
ncbi:MULTISPECIES: hypothetical protein [Leptolyngbya]|uniref:hypothetical protein n=1 Tax=Leptolyngbya TaxID=47251 RepID=UPI00056A30C6|nr:MULTISPECIES: hypothetical protein [Leptolyngbya]MBD2371090.1 hypothetical protein [Leptolyngbya sp. FACHB-161]MBD2377558.1 hypothetical protein [Leptolyngbya sp. FACHB-238]MBD2402011.1 hypothetical protein [Leptolyngbya sp. FACHB-239]MBD2408530.1 hypothetical protein [Leptolyngbya sp. FACHB-402]BAS60429.1 hypothetical protein LBWT_Y0170 [Leptolyngbya boryana IAM M-101]